MLFLLFPVFQALAQRTSGETTTRRGVTNAWAGAAVCGHTGFCRYLSLCIITVAILGILRLLPSWWDMQSVDVFYHARPSFVNPGIGQVRTSLRPLDSNDVLILLPRPRQSTALFYHHCCRPQQTPLARFLLCRHTAILPHVVFSRAALKGPPFVVDDESALP